MRRNPTIWQSFLVVLFILICIYPAVLHAAISGVCSDCHTMHNSQDGQVMADFAGETGPNPALTRGSCLGCHAQGGGQRIISDGTNQFPQVYHNDGQDLAAGNFMHITNSGDNRGHNVVDLVGNADGTLLYPPGFRHGGISDANELGIDIPWMTCAGVGGCHGMRGQVLSPPGESGVGEMTWRVDMTALRGYGGASANYFSGAHHGNYEGYKEGGTHSDFSTNPLTHSYRFLYGLQGHGNPNAGDRWQNISSTSHNEYRGVSGMTIDYNIAGCWVCHTGGQRSTTSWITTPLMRTTGLCITCHSDFHSTGAEGTTAFRRHPSDFTIKNEGEYAAYTTYAIKAPVARTDVSAGVSNVVNPGSDMVMCLSCHMAHASPYPDMLRWDYQNDCSAGSENADCGCMTCHTTKDD